jgi:hypothetical protein
MEYLLIKFYTKVPQSPELFCMTEEFDKFLERFRVLTKNGSKFVVHRFNNRQHCVGDFS